MKSRPIKHVSSNAVAPTTFAREATPACAAMLSCWALLGCGEESTDAADPVRTEDELDVNAQTSCAEEERADVYTPGMSQTTSSGMAVSLSESDPSPPARTDNAWLLMLTDEDDQPLTNVNVSLDPQMPDHGHGVPRRPVVTELGEGRYEATPVSLFMPGYWTVEVALQVDDVSESVQFDLCVD